MSADNWEQDALATEISVNRIRLALLQLRWELSFRRRRAPQAKYRADQPRVPAGNPDGGQWTSEGAGGDSGAGNGGLGDWQLPVDRTRIERVGNRSRSGGGHWPGSTPAQQARLAASDLQAQAAIRRVQEIDPRWRPASSLSEGIEGAILSNQASVRQAEARILELQRIGIGPGPFAVESVPARSRGRTTGKEQAEIDSIGQLFGCHSCGTTAPLSSNGRFIGDHQLPTALGRSGEQRLFPHCKACSAQQGGFIMQFKRKR